MEFQLLKETITVSPSRESYNKYRLKFQSEAKNAVQRFHKLYQTNTSLENAVQSVPEQMYQSMVPAIKLCVQIMIDHGVLTVDEDRFIDMYPEVLEPAREAYQKIQDQYAEIVLDESEKDAYRKARREGRGRWVGGGFSLKGAVKGAVTAGMLNAASDIGHRAFNGVAKATSSISSRSKMNKIFQSKDTEGTLQGGLYQSVYLLHIALIDCLNQTGADRETIGGVVTSEDSETAAAILKNIPQIRVPEQQYDAMVQAFQLDPYQETWYRLALQLYGDAEGTLEAVERYFGISVIRKEKERQLNEFVRTLPLETEQQAQQAVKEIEEAKKRLHYSGETEQTKSVQAAIERFDTDYRTVEGITFSTRQEADAARAETVEINRVLQNIDYTNLDSIVGGEHKLKDFSSPLAVVRQKELHQRWDDLDVRLRTVDTLLPDGKHVLCDAPEQAERLRPVVQDLKNRLDACGNGPSAEKPLNELKHEISTIELPTAIANSYKSEITDRLQTIDHELRTTLGKEYPTREAAREAERLHQQIRADFTTENPRKNGGSFRQRIEAANFSDEVKEDLLGELFQFENKRELQTAKTFSTISSVILLAIVIASYFFHLSGTPAFAQKNVFVRGVSLMLTDVQETNQLSFIDGLKNGLVVFGRCIGDIFVNGFFEYTGGFTYGLAGNILWAFLGLFWVLIKQFLLGIARYLVSLVVTIIQTAPVRYYIGYVIGAAIPLAVSQFSFDEDEQEENVRRIKGWNIKKIGLAVLVVIVVAAVVVYFVSQELQ